MNRIIKHFPCYAPFWRGELPYTYDMCNCKKECMWKYDIPKKLKDNWAIFVEKYKTFPNK